MMKAYIRAVGALSRAFAALATLLLVAAMLVVCEMILIRYVFRAATIWQTDFVVFSATAAMFLGAPYVLLKGGHVGVDVVEMIVSDHARGWLRIIGGILGLCFCLIMLWASWLQFHEAFEGDWRHSSVWAPRLWIPLSALPLGFGMLCLQYVAQILVLISGGSTPHAPDPLGGLATAPVEEDTVR
ncbi:TRAP-type C4-dicarboxylate transport system permease small subunit [Rhodoligotrophos appendicifer]|uniref:TRAP transporter small permease subunit n=1 Tax=Rhodoligotrophos appendicifer TaxID=987056 RepID=UPI0011868475|nr:TRAP transporter small permease [Rhodoligotrophos appendicifer]